MKRMWAPWRGEYITSPIWEGTQECLFCALAEKEPSRDNLIIYKTKKTFVVMNKFPYNNGHIMVVPKKHADTFDKLSDDEYLELSEVLKQALTVINKVYKPQGCNIGMNIGRSAGAGIDSHIHYHIVPRWNGDTNFMPLISEVKVISEHFFSTYDKLTKAFMEVFK